MNVTFTRTGDRTYATLAERDDAVVVRVPSYDRPSAIPHDIAHLVVEQRLNLRHGFWGSVAAGALFPNMRVVSGRLRPHAAEQSRLVIRRAGDWLTEAEVLVGALLHITENRIENDWPRACKHLRAGWQPRHASRGPIGREEVKHVCGELREAQAQWAALPVGADMRFQWAAQPNCALNRTRHQMASHS